jgi:hypothetical protein
MVRIRIWVRVKVKVKVRAKVKVKVMARGTSGGTPGGTVEVEVEVGVGIGVGVTSRQALRIPPGKRSLRVSRVAHGNMQLPAGRNCLAAGCSSPALRRLSTS